MRLTIPKWTIEGELAMGEHIEVTDSDGKRYDASLCEMDGKNYTLITAPLPNAPRQLDLGAIRKKEADRLEQQTRIFGNHVQAGIGNVVKTLNEIITTLEQAEVKIRYMTKEFDEGNLSPLNFATMNNYLSAAKERLYNLLADRPGPGGSIDPFWSTKDTR